MRAVLTALLLLALAGVALWQLQGGAPELAPGPGSASVRAASAEPVAARSLPTVPSTASMRRPEGLAEQPTAYLQVVDAGTGAPVPGAAVYRLRAEADEAALAYSDPTGLVPLPLSQPGQLMVVHRGYLLRMAPTRPGSTAAAPQVVRLLRDDYSHSVSFRFLRPDGGKPEEVCVRFRPLRDDDGDQPMPATVRAAAEELQRAWREQRTLAAVRPVPEMHVQLGHGNAAFVHLLAADDAVAFVESGPFELEAATTDGFVAKAAFEVSAQQREPVAVHLQPGLAIVGAVRGEAGEPVADAFVAIAGGDPLRLLGRTDASGSFAIGPLAAGSYGLEVRHRDYETGRPGPFVAGSSNAVVVLSPLPQGTLRGRVLAAGTMQPIAGASAAMIDALGQATTVVTDDDGWFSLPSSGTEALRLNVGADGFLTHAELVDPAAGPFEFALWPATAEARRQRGLSSTLSGVVVDSGGRGIAGIGVRFVPDQPLQGFAGRRVLSGGSRSLPQATTTGSDGSFVLETASPGPGIVGAIDGSAAGDGVRITVVLGKDLGGLRVQARRR